MCLYLPCSCARLAPHCTRPLVAAGELTLFETHRASSTRRLCVAVSPRTVEHSNGAYPSSTPVQLPLGVDPRSISPGVAQLTNGKSPYFVSLYRSVPNNVRCEGVTGGLAEGDSSNAPPCCAMNIKSLVGLDERTDRSDLSDTCDASDAVVAADIERFMA